MFYAATWLTGIAHPTVPKLAVFWASADRSRRRLRADLRGAFVARTDSYVQNTVIVGAGHVGQQVAHKLLHHPEYGVNVVGFVDEHPRERRSDLDGLTVLGEIADLPVLVAALDIERVIVAFSQTSHTQTLGIIRDLNALDVQVDIVPRLFEVIGPQATIHAAEGIPLLGLAAGRLRVRRAWCSSEPWTSSGRVLGPGRARARSSLSIAARDQARLARPGPLPAGADRERRCAVRDPQVPHDGRTDADERKAESRI